MINKRIDFRRENLRQIIPATIPSFAFYQLMGRVSRLPKEFWPYLPGSSVHTLHLAGNQIGDEGASQLAQHLQESSVHTLDLMGNRISNATQQLLEKKYPHINWSF